MVYRCTATPGLEDISAREARETVPGFLRAHPKPLGAPGLLTIIARCEEGTESGLLGMSTIHHLVIHRFAARKPSLSRRHLGSLVPVELFPELDQADSFRVTCERIGQHDFTHPEAEREVGGRLQDVWRTPVNLSDPAVNIRLDIIGSAVFAGIQLSKQDLGRRYRWQYRPRVTLKPPVAAALIRMALHRREIHRPGSVTFLDPFCGSGTIALEAARLFPAATVIASDRDSEAVDGTRRNAEAAGLRISVAKCDARSLENIPDESVDFVVTNPPFGIRLGSALDFRAFYRAVLAALARVLKANGRICILAGKRRIDFTRALQDTGRLVRTHVRVVDLGGTYPAAFVLEKAIAKK